MNEMSEIVQMMIDSKLEEIGYDMREMIIYK